MAENDDIIDAEFETVAVSKDKRSAAKPERASAPKPSAAEGEEQLAVFGKAPAQKSRALPLPAFAAICVVLPAIAFYFAGGHALFGNSATTQIAGASETADRLRFQEVLVDSVTQDGDAFVKLTATIINTDSVARTLKPVVVTFGEDPTTRRMFRIERGETLNPGQSLIFTNLIPAGIGTNQQPTLTFSE